MIRLFSVAILVIAFTSAGISQVSYDYDKTADFSKYKTWSFIGWQKDSGELMNQLDKETLYNAIKSEFEERGIEYVKEGGEMMVSLYLVIKEQQQVEAYTNYTGGYGFARPWGYGAGIVGGTANTTYNTYDYQVGTLVMDCYDATSKDLLFQGIYKGAVQEKAQKRDKTIPKNVSKLMKNFPVQPEK